MKNVYDCRMDVNLNSKIGMGDPSLSLRDCRCYIIRGQFSKKFKGVNPLIP
jgi:hypothetical protein